MLARVTNVPILPVFTLRQKRLQYRVQLREPIHVQPTDDRRADLQATADRLAQEIESAIRQEPHQWFCFRDVWPDA